MNLFEREVIENLLPYDGVVTYYGKLLNEQEAAKYFDIKVLDHLIVSDDGYFSFADEGIL